MESLVISPSYLKPWDVELYNFRFWDKWCIDNWTLSIYASVIYVAAVFLGRKWMERRQAFELRVSLIAWNLFLAVASGVAFTRLFPELINEVHNYGFRHSICNRELHTMTNNFWNLVFMFSKIVEFGDTAFIVLRKQKLIFLHWYHHVTVAIYCFYVNGDFDPASRWFTTVNSFIHTLMYGYYTLKAMRVKIPRNFAMIITTMQIIQMIIGVLVNVYAVYWMQSEESCGRQHSYIFWSSLMYASYFALFVNFFVKTYGRQRLDKSRKD